MLGMVQQFLRGSSASRPSTNARTRAPGLHPAEPAPDPGHQLVKDAQPAAGAYAGASGHQTVFTCRHKPG